MLTWKRKIFSNTTHAMNKFIFLFLFLSTTSLIAQEKNIGTQLVLLGTGTPFANPSTSGPSLAIVVNNVSYIVDCGPGLVRRAEQANQKGIKALAAENLKKLFKF